VTNKLIAEMINYFGCDARRINHALKVWGFAGAIVAELESDERLKNVIDFTAILHDIGIKVCERKYNSTAGKYQEIEGPPLAREIMQRLNIDAGIIERVCFIIGHHHNYKKIDGLDFQVIIEADFIVNAFEDSMSSEAIATFSDKYFKTKSGKMILQQLYLS
jgi:HD superfamily phosphodiesterase